MKKRHKSALSLLRGKYYNHRFNAKKVGKEFLLTFEEWLQIWEDSGHLAERGHHKGQYVMARFGDKGPYAVRNVRIITIAENNAERKFSPEAMTKIVTFHTGRKRSEKTKANLRRAWKKRRLVPVPPEVIERRNAAIRAAWNIKLGRPARGST